MALISISLDSERVHMEEEVGGRRNYGSKVSGDEIFSAYNFFTEAVVCTNISAHADCSKVF
jgi:hypothetical protein